MLLRLMGMKACFTAAKAIENILEEGPGLCASSRAHDLEASLHGGLNRIQVNS